MSNEQLKREKETVLFSTILHAGNNQGTKAVSIENKCIIFDVDNIRLFNAFSFKNCDLKLSKDLDSFSLCIETDQIFRVENSDIYIYFVFTGLNKGDSRSGRIKGPSLFFDNCYAYEYEATFVGRVSKHAPKIQLHGLFDHCRVIMNNNGLADFSLEGCQFNLLQVENFIQSFQFGRVSGDSIIFKNFDCNYFWLREGVNSKVGEMSLDYNTVKNLCRMLKSHENFSEHILKSFIFIQKKLLEHREGALHNILNVAVCDYRLMEKVNYKTYIYNFLIYKFTRNFYSFKAMVYFAIGVILLFGITYYVGTECIESNGSIIVKNENGEIINPSYGDYLYFSAITFTTVGYGDIQPAGIMRYIAALEGLLGVFTVLVSSFVFTRRYSSY